MLSWASAQAVACFSYHVCVLPILAVSAATVPCSRAPPSCLTLTAPNHQCFPPFPPLYFLQPQSPLFGSQLWDQLSYILCGWDHAAPVAWFVLLNKWPLHVVANDRISALGWLRGTPVCSPREYTFSPLLIIRWTLRSPHFLSVVKCAVVKAAMWGFLWHTDILTVFPSGIHTAGGHPGCTVVLVYYAETLNLLSAVAV